MTHINSDPLGRHRAVFESAQHACRSRACWSAFAETPSQYPDGAQAERQGRAAFELHLGRLFQLDQPGYDTGASWVAQEVSPYTQELLGIRYAQSDVHTLFSAAKSAIPSWAGVSPEVRIGILLEIVDVLYREHLFEIIHAVMHTSGQSYNMAYAGSGVNALDRAIEALVYADLAMSQVVPQARWDRKFGSASIRLNKRYRIVPRGVAVCFTCASFATWNAWPSIMASLATGNAVIVKPHPTCILPMAISVRVMRDILARSGHDPNLVTMVIDSTSEPIGKSLVKHPDTAIVDFTGSVHFGQWVERNAYPALSFTETAGCNTVVLESVEDLDAVLRSLATTLCMFSAQMCTSPQNIYVGREGVRIPGGVVGVHEVGKRLAAAVREIAQDAKRAGMILATIQSPDTMAMLGQLLETGQSRGEVLLEPAPYQHPEFPNARTSTPLMLQVDTTAGDLYRQERFGPVSFVIECADSQDALTQATTDVKRVGGLTAFLYSTDEDFVARAEDLYAQAGAQLTINLTGAMPLNFAAAYSDYHVTGLNPAGNATLTDLSFVASRFRIAQSRRPVESKS